MLIQSLRKIKRESESESEVDQEIILKKFPSDTGTTQLEDIKEIGLLGESV